MKKIFFACLCFNIFFSSCKKNDEKPALDFDFSANHFSINDTVNFTSICENCKSLTWNFNGEGVSSEENPYFIFSTSGIKTITLAGSSRDGIKDSISKEFTIRNMQEIHFYEPDIWVNYVLNDLKKHENSVFVATTRWNFHSTPEVRCYLAKYALDFLSVEWETELLMNGSVSGAKIYILQNKNILVITSDYSYSEYPRYFIHLHDPSGNVLNSISTYYSLHTMLENDDELIFFGARGNNYDLKPICFTTDKGLNNQNQVDINGVEGYSVILEANFSATGFHLVGQSLSIQNYKGPGKFFIIQLDAGFNTINYEEFDPDREIRIGTQTKIEFTDNSILIYYPPVLYITDIEGKFTDSIRIFDYNGTVENGDFEITNSSAFFACGTKVKVTDIVNFTTILEDDLKDFDINNSPNIIMLSPGKYLVASNYNRSNQTQEEVSTNQIKLFLFNLN